MIQLAQLIPAFGILIVYGLLYLVTKVMVTHYKLKKRRSPFVGNFLRSPGESIRKRLEDLRDDIIVYLIYAMFLPLVFYSGILSQAYFGNKTPSLPVILMLLLLAALFEAYFVFKLVQLINRRRQFRLGYEGELAVGQEINQLLREGYNVYHDFPAEKFNLILKSSKSKPLDKSMVTRIVHQIDQRCRDVHPRASEGLAGKPGLPDKENA